MGAHHLAPKKGVLREFLRSIDSVETSSDDPISLAYPGAEINVLAFSAFVFGFIGRHEGLTKPCMMNKSRRHPTDHCAAIAHHELSNFRSKSAIKVRNVAFSVCADFWLIGIVRNISDKQISRFILQVNLIIASKYRSECAPTLSMSCVCHIQGLGEATLNFGRANLTISKNRKSGVICATCSLHFRASSS